MAHVAIATVAAMSIFPALGEAHILSVARAKSAAKHDAALIARIKPSEKATYKVDHCRRLNNHRVNCRAMYNFVNSKSCFQHTIRVRLDDPPSTDISNTYTIPVKISCDKF